MWKECEQDTETDSCNAVGAQLHFNIDLIYGNCLYLKKKTRPDKLWFYERRIFWRVRKSIGSNF